MRGEQRDFHLPHPHQHNDMADQLKTYREQLNAWEQQRADIEERFAAIREYIPTLQAHMEVIHAWQHYLDECKQHLLTGREEKTVSLPSETGEDVKTMK